MELKAKIEEARKLGAEANKAGMQRAPILNRRVQDLLHGMKVGEGASEIMSAYSTAWDVAEGHTRAVQAMGRVHEAASH